MLLEAERRRSISRWQRRLSELPPSGPGAIVRGAIGGELEAWTGRAHGALTYRVTQILTGHGVFEAYLYRIGRRDTPICLFCRATRDTAAHTLLFCPFWAEQRYTGASPAEYVYGTTLRIPGEFIFPDDFTPNPHAFLEEFREYMRKVKPVPVDHRHKKHAFLFKDLYTCTHVFLRVGSTKKALERPYTGPHKIIERISDRIFDIDVNGGKRSVSVENLKPAHFVRDNLSDIVPQLEQPLNTSSNLRSTLRTYARPKKVTFTHSTM
ncbi:hypothetical protein ALC57_15455 [Trachymyrmex cornetzi]|uniref:Reverse transcriptase zinc-binding domain-containing protein n=1 Tax=Trachymyrmex cornetzi TaxID=471704 RepID=A0A151IX12_9HYME|nr:hypothetical protein ALC57_15455 [Trachymyrmex cornetzi]